MVFVYFDPQLVRDSLNFALVRYQLGTKKQNICPKWWKYRQRNWHTIDLHLSQICACFQLPILPFWPSLRMELYICKLRVKNWKRRYFVIDYQKSRKQLPHDWSLPCKLSFKRGYFEPWFALLRSLNWISWLLILDLDLKKRVLWMISKVASKNLTLF